jgi:S-(hydroxymethyl)glutathione dehydrogenase/alcohol dehydrogenase
MLLNEKKFMASLGGSCEPERDFPMFLDWYGDGRLDLDALVTARYPIEDINKATTDLEEGRIFGRSILVFD